MDLVLVRNAGLSVAKIELADGRMLSVQPKSDRKILKELLSSKQLKAIKSGDLADCYVELGGKMYEPKPAAKPAKKSKKKKEESEVEIKLELEPDNADS